MKKVYIVITMLLIISFLISCVSNFVYAGYNDKESKSNLSIENSNNKGKLLTNVVEYTDDIENVDEQTIIIIPFENIEYTNFDLIKSLMLENSVSVLIGYTTFQSLTQKISDYDIDVNVQAFNEILQKKYEYMEQYNNNGLIDLRIEDNNQLFLGAFFTKAQQNDVILKNYNMYKGNINYDIVESSEQIVENPVPYASQGNYELRFYWSGNIENNKVYASASTSSSILVSLYRSEMMQNLGTTSSRTYNDSYGGTYHEYFIKVQANNSSGSLTAGYFLSDKSYDPNNGDEGWTGGDYWYQYSYTLNRLLQSAYNNDFQSARTGGHVYYKNGYYGVRIKKATSIYNSSGSYLRSAPVGSVVWVSGSNKCGYSNPQYMTINGYSSSGSTSITTYSSTTFVDAGLLTTNPTNYNIDIRWW